MHLMLSMLVVCACALCAVSASVPPQQCSSKTEETRGFTIKSSINVTGHWQYKVDLIHVKSETYRPWSVALDQTTVKCDGVEYVHTTATITAPNAKAGPGYEFYPGMGYYKLHTNKTVWDTAKIICEKEGGHLAIINSPQEAALLVKIAARFSSLGPYISIGFHDKYQEGQVVTIFDEPISASGYTNWCGHQPDNAGGNENCGSIVGTVGCLNDIPCDNFPKPFFCEQELS